MGTFNGLTQEHFDTYAPEKWSSMVHNLARMKSKDAVQTLSQEAEGSIEEHLASLMRGSSDEIPNISNQRKVDSQWVYWYRNKQQREELSSFLSKTPLNQNTIFNIAAHEKHLTLAVILRHQELWIGLRLAGGAVVDRKNFAAKLSKSWQREQFSDSLKGIPAGCLIELEGEGVSTEAASLDNLAEMTGPLANNQDAWALGHSISRDRACELGPELKSYVGEWLKDLAPIYHYIAWTRDNDFIEVAKQLQQEKAQKRHQAAGFKAGDRVRLTGGLFSGKIGAVETVDTKGRVKVSVGKMSVVVAGTDLVPLR